MVVRIAKWGCENIVWIFLVLFGFFTFIGINIYAEDVQTNTVYVVVKANTLQGLESSVNFYLDNGWKLQGGVSYVPNGEYYVGAKPMGYFYTQAVYKDKEP